jgi:hypothetical protein
VRPRRFSPRFSFTIADHVLRFDVRVLCRIACRRETILVVHLAGRLSEAHVPDLLEACGQAKHPIVELDELVSADAVGIDALLRLQQDGARLIGTPEYLRLKLETLARERGN